MALQPGKIYTPLTAAEPRDNFLTDVRLEARKYADEDEVDRITRPGTDWHILGTALGNIAILQYANISRADEDIDETTATGAALDRIREALGLPEVPASPATGHITIQVDGSQLGAISLSNHEFVLPNGKRGKIDGIHTITVGTALPDIPAVTIDTGDDVNFPADTLVRFVSPPAFCPLENKVSIASPLTGGDDGEVVGDPVGDERKRLRIQNKRQNIPAGGNWGHMIELSLDALATVQYAFVYPALGGPGSVKVIVVRDVDPDNYTFTRQLPAPALQIVRNAIHASMPAPMEIVVDTAADSDTDAALTLNIPDAVSAGGNGQGWLDAAPWPPLAGGDTKVSITLLLTTDGSQIRVNATTATPPVAGQTHISWWSQEDQKFHTRLVTAQSGGTGAWNLTLDAPLVDHNNAIPQVGEYISPAAVNIDDYGRTWIDQMRKLGPGENTADGNRLPRALRRPFIADSWPSSLTAKQLIGMGNAHGEIRDIAWSFRSQSTPSVPANVTIDPNILTPRHFGVYKM